MMLVGKQPGRGDQLGRLELRAMDLRDAVDGLLQERGRGMIVTVEFLVDGRIGRAEIGAQIDHRSCPPSRKATAYGAAVP